MRSKISNFANRKFGDLLHITLDGEEFSGRFVSATVNEHGVATVRVIPVGGDTPITVTSNTATILAESPDTEWVEVPEDIPLDNLTVRFRHRLTPSIVYPTDTVSSGEEVLGDDWEVELEICPGGSTVEFTSEYWIMEQEAAVEPLADMPTEPGVYTSADGDVWQHDPAGPWNATWRNLTRGSFGTEDEARPFGPFIGPLTAVQGPGKSGDLPSSGPGKN